MPSRMETKNDYLFGVYYQIGPERSLEKMAELCAGMGLKIGLSSLKRYSYTFGWQQRVMEVDAKYQEERDAQHAQAIQTMNDRQAGIGRAMQGLGAQGLRNIQASLLNPSEITSLTREGVRIERLAMGEATSRSEVAIQVVNRVILAIVDLFNQINNINNADERKRQFALGADHIIEAKTTEVLQDTKPVKAVEV